ncbi:MAG: acyl-CoA dehydrogenase family protein [Rubrivivax sp.]
MHAQDWVAIADRAGQALAGRAAAFEAARALPDDVADQLADAGLHGLLLPRGCGGAELDPATFFDAIARLARHEAASAWCSFIGCTASVLVSRMGLDDARRLMHRPGLRCAGVFAPRGRAEPARQDGVPGWRVQGSWAWGSGTANAHWISVGCVAHGDDGRPVTLADGSPRVLSAWLAREQVTLRHDWDACGLGGTGSGQFDVAPGTFVPAWRAVSIFDAPRHGGPLYRFPVFGLLALGIAAVSCGLARHALDAFADLAGAKVPQGATRVLAQRAAAQDAMARAEAAWRGARAFVHEAVAAAWSEAQQGGADELPLALRRDLRLACTHMADSAAELCTRLFTVAGGSAVFAASPLQRCLRDALVARQHLMVAEPTWELCGRLLLGQPAPVATL